MPHRTTISCALVLSLTAAACGDSSDSGEAANAVPASEPSEGKGNGPDELAPGDGGAQPDGASADGASAEAGPACEAGEVLIASKCIDPATDSSHCGASGAVCGAGTGCFGGTCTTPAMMPPIVKHPTFNGPAGPAAATTGNDGRIYVFFWGWPSGIFDPRTNLWTSLPRAPAELPLRADGEAGTLADGRIWIAAGGGLHVLNEAAGTWSTLGAATFRTNTSYARVDDELYAFGRFTTNNTPTAAVNSFNLTTQVWTPRPNMPGPRTDFPSVTTKTGRIYIFGGGYISGDSYKSLNRVDVYDPATSTWSAAAPLPGGPSYPVATLGADGRIFVVGGAAGATNRFDIYSPDTNTWSQGPTLSAGRRHPAMVTGKDGRIYVFGDQASADQTVRVYEPARNVWVN